MQRETKRNSIREPRECICKLSPRESFRRENEFVRQTKTSALPEDGNIFMCVPWHLETSASSSIVLVRGLWLKSASGRVLRFDVSCSAFSRHSPEKERLMYEKDGSKKHFNIRFRPFYCEMEAFVLSSNQKSCSRRNVNFLFLLTRRKETIKEIVGRSWESSNSFIV